MPRDGAGGQACRARPGEQGLVHFLEREGSDLSLMTSTAPVSLPKRLDGWRDWVNQELERLCVWDANACPPRLCEAIRYSLLGDGKRLRPLLVLSAAEACGVDLEGAIPAALAVEMVHAYSLIHDDLPAMDDDDLRRGRPTCHIAFDEPTAILAGDALLAMAFESVSSLADRAVAGSACQLLARAAGPCHLVGGQMDDLIGTSADPTLAQLEGVHRRKTGALLAVSLVLGGLVAGADQQTIDALETYGQKIGLAFQIVDDLLDHQGDETALGKRTQRDATLGKTTYPAVLGVAASRQRANELVASACAELAILEGPTDALNGHRTVYC